MISIIPYPQSVSTTGIDQAYDPEKLDFVLDPDIKKEGYEIIASDGKVTVRYSDGNERNGNVTLGVLWRDAVSEDFKPVISDDVYDYYGDVVNITIPDGIDDGQIIVTVKYRNSYGADVPGIDVTASFDSQAVFIFNVADIKANYADAFGLSMAKLGIDGKDGNYSVDVGFTADGERIQLTLKEYELLKAFMESTGSVHSREQLLHTVWGTDFTGETRTVDVHIGTLRTKLGKYGDLIKTVRGVGYVIRDEHE